MNESTKSNWEMLGIIFAILLGFLLFLSLGIQIPALYNASVYKIAESPLVHLSIQEKESICQDNECNYTHKIKLNDNDIIISHTHHQYFDKIWIFYEEKSGKKIFKDYSDFLYGYILFDLLTIGFIWCLRIYFKKEKLKNPARFSKNKLFSRKKKETPSEEEEPLPPYRWVFVLGCLQYVFCFGGSYFLHRSFPHNELISFVIFLFPFVTGVILYYSYQRRIGFLLTSFVCFAPAMTGNDILYIHNLNNPEVKIYKENVFELPEGELDFSKRSLYVDVMRSSGSGRSTSKKIYTYYFTVPYHANPQNKNYVDWISLKKEFIEDPAKWELFFQEWKIKRLVVQIWDEQVQFSVSKAKERYNLPFEEVAIFKPILSLEEEIETTLEKVFWMNGIALLLFFGLSYLRFSAED
jgi:hypothetical protein